MNKATKQKLKRYFDDNYESLMDEAFSKCQDRELINKINLYEHCLADNMGGMQTPFWDMYEHIKVLKERQQDIALIKIFLAGAEAALELQKNRS